MQVLCRAAVAAAEVACGAACYAARIGRIRRPLQEFPAREASVRPRGAGVSAVASESCATQVRRQPTRRDNAYRNHSRCRRRHASTGSRSDCYVYDAEDRKQRVHDMFQRLLVHVAAHRQSDVHEFEPRHVVLDHEDWIVRLHQHVHRPLIHESADRQHLVLQQQRRRLGDAPDYRQHRVLQLSTLGRDHDLRDDSANRYVRLHDNSLNGTDWFERPFNGEEGWFIVSVAIVESVAYLVQGRLTRVCLSRSEV